MTSRASGSMVRIEGGELLMGSDDDLAYVDDGEGPAHRVVLSPFRIDAHAVSNRRFAEFAEDSGHRTVAEELGWSFVFAGLLPSGFQPTRGVVGATWWRQVHGASWRHPEGPGSGLEGREDHPVVHVSWGDAAAFCDWAGGRLPTEAEWEMAARGGVEGKAFPWGDDLEPGGEHRMNVWQGDFPATNTVADGWYGTAPVDAYPPNGYGLRNTTGNVWEWCSDIFSSTYYRTSPVTDPTGPEIGLQRVMRGGSYLCHSSYCRRYRVSARTGNDALSSAGNVGFRCAADP